MLLELPDAEVFNYIHCKFEFCYNNVFHPNQISDESLLEVSGDIFTAGHAMPNIPYRITIKLNSNELQLNFDVPVEENLKVQVRGPFKEDSSSAIRYVNIKRFKSFFLFIL